MLTATTMRIAAEAAAVDRGLQKVEQYLAAYSGSRGPLQIAWSGYQRPEIVRQWLTSRGFRLTGVDAYGATIHWS